MSKATFEIPRGARPLKAAMPESQIATRETRERLRDGYVLRATHPRTKDEALYLVTTDSYIVAYVPLYSDWRGRKQRRLPRKALSQALDNGRRFTVDEIEEERKSPYSLDNLVPKIGGIVEDPQVCFDPRLYDRLILALGWRSDLPKYAPRLTIIGLHKPIVVDVPDLEPKAFGLLMPIKRTAA